MKTRAFLLFFLGFSLSGNAQFSGSSQKTVLDSIVKRLQSGIYERTLNLGYIASTPKLSRKNVPVPHNEFTMMIFRFYDFSYDTTSNSYIGKVFMGERYLESQYNKKYNSVAAYTNDKDGFFMACKLFYHEHSMEYRLHVYPDYILNICNTSHDPFMGTHFNTHICKNTETHWQSIRYLAALNDQSYNAISEENDSTQVSRFFKQAIRQKINIDTTFIDPKTYFSGLSKKQKNILREINLHKHIKCFMVGGFFDLAANLAKSLKLRSTKYSLSDDILENAEYDFHFLELTPGLNAFLKLRGTNKIFITRNPLYRSLVVSFEPDETYIPEIPKLDVFTFYDQGLTTIIPYKSAKNNDAETGTDINRKKEEEVIRKQQQENKGTFSQERPLLTNSLQKKDILSVSIPLSSVSSFQTVLDSLEKNFITIVSADDSPQSWIYWPSSEKIKDTVTLQKDLYLRANHPKQLENVAGWLRGSIKGVARQNETYKVDRDSKFVTGKHTWLKVEKIDTPEAKKR